MEEINYQKESLGGLIRFGVSKEDAKAITDTMVVAETKRKRITKWKKVKYPNKKKYEN